MGGWGFESECTNEHMYILGDDAFPLKFWLLRPYSSHCMDLKEKVFNCRISRGRSVVENAFRIRTSLFRIFHSPLQQEPLVVNRVVMACLVLHNLLRIRYPTAQQEDFWGEGQHTIGLEGNDIPDDGCNTIGAVKRQRNIFRDYFMGEGQVPGKKGKQLKCEILLYCEALNVNRTVKHF